VRLEVEDEGVGMVPEVLRRVFEPFFTTKGSGKGTGLGMPIVFSIARSHGGAVRVWSRVGRGTSVAMFVPIAPAHTQSRPPERLSDEDLERFAGTETILVVDDEAIVRSVGTKILKQFGYRTVEAASGSEALRIVADERENVAAILLDIVMPEMEGPEVFKRLKERGIDVPVLLCSGFSVAGLVDGMRAQGVAGFVQKPYRLRELLPALRAALDGRPVAARG
jgi:two-component system cell cycle sensor histidine kinase/response regulator CckA